MISMHIFDMDHTLIEADCDVTWKEFLVSEKIAPPEALIEADKFFDDYNRGCMDQNKFNDFQLREFINRTEAEMAEISAAHFKKMILPNIRPLAEKQISEVLSKNLPCAILTSTNSVIARPVAEYFGIKELYGTLLELENGRYTGKISGTYCAGEGKCTVLKQICAGKNISPTDVAAYGDSVNDAPLLKAVGHPFAVSPSEKLRQIAEQNNWTILDWRLDKI